jgi:hypothetical protein
VDGSCTYFTLIIIPTRKEERKLPRKMAPFNNHISKHSHIEKSVGLIGGITGLEGSTVSRYHGVFKIFNFLFKLFF